MFMLILVHRFVSIYDAQSFVAESIYRIDELTDGHIPGMFLFDSIDFDEANGIDESTMQWILGFSDIVGCKHTMVHHLTNARDTYSSLGWFEIGTYTLIDDIDEYIEYFEMGIDGVFTDDVGTARVVKELLNELEEGDNVAFETFCASTDDDEASIGTVEAEWAIIGAVITMFVGAMIGALIYHCCVHKKLQSEVHHQGVESATVQMD